MRVPRLVWIENSDDCDVQVVLCPLSFKNWSVEHFLNKLLQHVRMCVSPSNLVSVAVAGDRDSPRSGCSKHLSPETYDEHDLAVITLH